jgi:hypothetical protein
MYAKFIKETRKQKIEKEKRKKRNKRPRGPIRPSRRIAPKPSNVHTRIGTLALSLFHWQVEPTGRWDRLVRPSSTSGHLIRKLPSAFPPPLIPIKFLPNMTPPRAYKCPVHSSPIPLFSPSQRRHQAAQLLIGAPHICGLSTSIPVRPDHPAPPSLH